MTEDRRARIIVVRKEKKDAIVAPGSAVYACYRCNKPVWLAPAGQAVLADRPDTELVCTHCMPVREMLVSHGSIGVAPGAFEEIRQVLGDEGVERAKIIAESFEDARRRLAN